MSSHSLFLSPGLPVESASLFYAAEVQNVNIVTVGCQAAAPDPWHSMGLSYAGNHKRVMGSGR